MKRLPTRCRAVDTLLDGGLATGTITQVFGEKALGKSILSFQSACSVVASGNSTIVLDTEQSYASYLVPYWRERMSKRFGMDIRVSEVRLERTPKLAGRKKVGGAVTRGELITALSGTLSRLGVAFSDSHLGAMADMLSPDAHAEISQGDIPSVMVVQVPEVTDLLSLHGIDAAKTVSEGGRVELRLRQAPVHVSALLQMIKETDARLLVYDSISAPFKASFPGTQDLPARSAGLTMLLSHAQRLCFELGIAVLVVSHLSVDPTKAGDRRPYGGTVLGHEAKFSIELTKAKAERNGDAQAVNPEDEAQDGREFWVARHPRWKSPRGSGMPG